MAPDLLFHPVLNEAEALAGVPNREVIHPATQDRVDQLDHPVHGLGSMAAEHVLELPQQCRSFLELRREACSPDAPSTADAAEVESQEAEAFAAAEVHDPTLLFIDFDLQSGQFLPKPFLHRRHQPVMPRVGVHQDHQIVSKTRILDVGVLAVACDLLCPLEHPVYLVEVEITEQWGDHSALRDAASTIGFQHDLQQVHHIIIIDSLRHFGQQSVVPDVVKIAPQIDIYDACLVLNDCLGHSVERFMSCLLGTVSKRSRLEVGLKDRLQDELERPLHHPIPDSRN